MHQLSEAATQACAVIFWCVHAASMSPCPVHLCARSIMASMSDQQLDRYEAFRRSSLARPKMKQVCSRLRISAVEVQMC